MSSQGVAGSDRNINQARISPVEGNRGQYQHAEPHADTQGVVGRDETIQGAKVDPLMSQTNEATRNNQGLDDEQVAASRVEPLGSVREEMR